MTFEDGEFEMGDDDESEEDREHKRSSGNKRVVDEEGTVDQKIKDRIIRSRNRVDKREDLVFIQAPLDPQVEQLNRRDQLEIWGTAVRQYIRSIEPLLKSDAIPESGHYYGNHPIVKERIMPPPKDGIDWSLFHDDDIPQESLIREHETLDRSFTPPQPKTFTLRGLKSVIETDHIEVSWTVVHNPSAIQPRQTVSRIALSHPLKKPWLESAVRVADEFLQKAGVGLDIGHEETDDQDDEVF